MNSDPEPPNLLGMLPEDLVAHLADAGERCGLDEARRVLAHIISGGADDLAMKRPVRRTMANTIESTTSRRRLEVVDRIRDPGDDSVRYLLRSPDGALSEAVLIPLHKAGRFSACLSSQVGCAMACDFCATGRLGLSRNLEAWEIVAAFCTLRDEADGRVSGAVFMGQGEPFHNYDHVIQAARVLTHPCGGRIAQEAVSISTVGLVPQIRRFTAEGHRFRLLISLTSAVPERRVDLLPVAGRYPLEALADAIREHQASRGGRVTVAWVLMGGVNTGADEVAALRELLEGVPIRLDLIDVNDARSEAEGGYRRAGDDERDGFFDALQILRVPIVRRYSVGRAQNSACGMLASKARDVAT